MVNVIIDTQALRKRRFEFSHSEFETLRNFADASKIRIFTTPVIDGEVRRQLTAESIEAQQALRKVLTTHTVLRHSTKVQYPDMVAKGALAELTDARLKQFDDWKVACDTEVLDVDEIDVSAILRRYFDGSPPFGSGKKKAEFPDAITLAAAERWCEDNDEKLVIVSEDSDIASYCESHACLRCIRTLGEFLENFTDDALVKKLSAALVDDKLGFLRDASGALEDTWFTLEEAKGSVRDIKVQDSSVSEIRILEAADGTATAEIEIDFEIIAKIEYTDPDSGIYDSEDGVMLFTDDIETEVQAHENAVFTIDFTYDELNPSSVEITDWRMDDEPRFISLPDQY